MPERFPSKCGAQMIADPLGEPDIVEFENSLGIRLPEDYREFLHEWNGVRFLGLEGQEPGTFPAAFPTQSITSHTPHTPNLSTWKYENAGTFDSIGSLGFLFELNKPELENKIDLRNANEGYEFNKWVPKHFQVIGEQFDNYNFISISLSGDDRGHIYNWAYPEAEEPQPGVNCPTMRNMSWIAPNFREFWDVLREMKEEAWTQWM